MTRIPLPLVLLFLGLVLVSVGGCAKDVIDAGVACVRAERCWR